MGLAQCNWTHGVYFKHQYALENRIGFAAHAQLYNTVIAWIKESIDKPYERAQWHKIGDCLYVNFVDEKDAVAFTLKWSWKSLRLCH